jgi:hypothetical protein
MSLGCIAWLSAMSMSGDDGKCCNCGKWFTLCKCGTPIEELPDKDDCGNNWYPQVVAIRWPVGTPVVCRRKSRETGEWRYSMFERWQGAGSGTFDDESGFLMLSR